MLDVCFSDSLVTVILYHLPVFLDMHIGTQSVLQSYHVANKFPFNWIKKQWAEGFHVTAMATSRRQWAVVSSNGTRFTNQVLVYSPPFMRLPDYSSFQDFPLKCLEPEVFALIQFIALNF